MEKLVFGKNGQVHFDSVEERDEAVEYIKNTPENVDYNVHEDNQNQGAWGYEAIIISIKQYYPTLLNVDKVRNFELFKHYDYYHNQTSSRTR